MPSASWANGWLTGDVVTAAEFRKGMGCVADTTLGGSAASIDITGLPTSYALMMLFLYLRGDTASTGVTNQIRFNNDSGSNYSAEYIQGSGSNASSAENLAQSSMDWGVFPAASSPANSFGSGILVIPHYAGATNHKACVGLTVSRSNTTTQTTTARTQGGVWFATSAAISRVTLTPSAGNWVSGSRVTIYMGGS